MFPSRQFRGSRWRTRFRSFSSKRLSRKEHGVDLIVVVVFVFGLIPPLAFAAGLWLGQERQVKRKTREAARVLALACQEVAEMARLYPERLSEPGDGR